MASVKQGVKKILREDYERACNAYLVELSNMWHWDSFYGYWVDDCIGGLYAYGDDTFISIDDIIFCVDNDIKEEEYEKWKEYCLFAHEYNFEVPKFESWVKGCPRISDADQKKIIKKKKEFESFIDKCKCENGF